MKKKIIITILSIILAAIVGGLLIGINYKKNHDAMNEAFINRYLQKSSFSDEYSQSQRNKTMARMYSDDICLTIADTPLSTYTSNLSIYDGSNSTYMIIWVDIKNDEKYFRVTVKSDDESVKAIDFDINGKATNKEEQKLLEENKEEIQKYLDIARDEWKIEVNL
ncbi:MAG: hypothetical protein K6G88_13940 [Lachnospiraceae bacterium]|nr:hypothetical protein [Lachnospiraceae bacterium]